MGEKRRRHFPDPAPKKVVNQVKVVFRTEKIVATIHTGFATFTSFFPVALEKCQFLASHISVEGSENVTRLIMIQGIISQPMVVLSAGVGELTLGAE